MTQIRTVEQWAAEPLAALVREAGARLSLLTTPSGQVIAQYGFTRSVDVMAAAALGAGIVSSTAQIAAMLEETGAIALNHQGSEHGIFISTFDSPRGQLLVLVVYGIESSPGLVQLFFEDFVDEVARVCPAPDSRRVVLAENFENELNSNLATLFGR
ncbi:MAG: hypothetical protein ACE5FJ_07555 [Gemmatimonadales bacterium]